MGRLSMWRAYGGITSVALVVNSDPIASTLDTLETFSSRVEYLEPTDFVAEFERVVNAIEANADFIRERGREALKNSVFHMIRTAVLCTKHPGFHEEREWRAIYCPEFAHSDKMVTDVQVIRGVPQPIVKLPLREFPSEGLTGLSVPAFLNKVIIGPTDRPWVIRDAYVTRLKDAGVDNAERKVIVSEIPLRQ